MAVTYTVCGPEITDAIQAAMTEYHPKLIEAGVTVSALLAEKIDEESGEVFDALFTRGQVVAAKISITSLEDRILGLSDAKLVINRKSWEGFSAFRRRALLDHELQHLELVPEERDGPHPVALDGMTRLDDARRPKLKLRHHDWEITGFAAVVERHGEASVEAAQFSAFEDRYGQLCLFGPAAGKSVAEAVR